MVTISPQQLASIRQFCRTQPVLRAYLFGSYARGEADEKSDIDLFFDLDYENIDALDFLLWREYLSEALQQKVDVVSGRKPNNHFYRTIEPDLQLVYERAAW